jgi:DNA-binding beta-propeller fold protein YncE
MRIRRPLTLLALAALAGVACENAPGPTFPAGFPNGAKPFVNFETIPLRPVAMSPDGTRLFVTNTPDGRLEIFQVTAAGLTAQGSVSVGLDPIAVNARTNNEVWVVNHLSDSVSVVDVTPGQLPRVSRTLLVGDEPRDVVFAGAGNSRAFVTAARRGQNHPVNTALLTQTPGEPRADVWVFDANNLGTGLAANRLAIIPLFSDKPGAMGVSPDGSQVFVAAFTSGNGSAVVTGESVCGTNNMVGRASTQGSAQNAGPCSLGTRGTVPGGVPAPNRNYMDNLPSPRTGVLVDNNRATGAWLDQLGRDWRAAIPFTFPDNDVFAINAGTLTVTRTFQTVGTLNFDVAVHPTDGRIFVATIDAINMNRFVSVPSANLGPNVQAAGAGVFRPGLPVTADPATGRTLRGHLYESRVAILAATGTGVTSRHLNKHINYEQFPVPAGVLDRSVANPQSLAFNANGTTLFVGALGSNKIVPFNTAALSNDTFQPDAATHIPLTGRGGPAGIALDPGNANRMFVYKRFDNAVAIVDIAGRRETASIALTNPEPMLVQQGRLSFYDARTTSDNGEANCNVCHPAADKDDLAWDLGAPFLPRPTSNPNMFVLGVAIGFGGSDNQPPIIPDPLKGPMTVLTLRGIKDSGGLFWRGDAVSPTPFDERANFLAGIPIVFEALNGRTGGIPAATFNQLTDWALTLVPPPNPHRPLNQVLNQFQMPGQGTFTNAGTGATGNTDVIFVCNTCHSLDIAQGKFGAGGLQSTEGETQFFKVTQLRTTYDKVGMFGATRPQDADNRPLGGVARTNVGPQIRASGTLHDGSLAGAEEFLTSDVFQLTAAELRNVVDFVYAFPSNVAPIVGQQVTLRGDSGADVVARVDLLQQRAAVAYVTPDSAFECDLVAKGVVNNQARAYQFNRATGNFTDNTGATITSAALRTQARVAGQQVTFTCVNSGGGPRIGARP